MGNVITYIALNDLIPSEFHPHLEYQQDNLENLTNSIKKIGIIEPLIVRKKDNKYEIIIGNRRYNAAKILNIDKLPAIIREINDEQAIYMIIANNLQRKELTSKEEAQLYEKALVYQNQNIEQLSITLGIPEDRIQSKLKIIKKLNTNPLIQNSKEIEQQQNMKNNLINNDIINLTELNNNEIRKERLNMNENQFMPNNINNEGIQQNNEQINQEPTFGGRFFPSMDNLTAMNNQPNIQQPQTNTSPEPLINLTDNGPINNIDKSINNQIPVPNITPEPQTNQSVTLPNIEVPNFNLGETNNITAPIENPQPEININSEIPNLTPNIPELNIEQGPNIPQMPQQESQINISTPLPINENTSNTTLNLDNMPNLNIPTPSVTTSSKDITPIVNIIKNIVSNMELMGYNLKITEDDTGMSYKIDIEVEK